MAPSAKNNIKCNIIETTQSYFILTLILKYLMFMPKDNVTVNQFAVIFYVTVQISSLEK